MSTLDSYVDRGHVVTDPDGVRLSRRAALVFWFCASALCWIGVFVALRLILS